MDPIGFAGGGVNLYGYVGNGILLGFDPLGLYEATRVKKILMTAGDKVRTYLEERGARLRGQLTEKTQVLNQLGGIPRVGLFVSENTTACGFSADYSTITPTGGGGGIYGFNWEYTSTSGGWHLYCYYTPLDQNSIGLELGWSITGNIAMGNGPWTGDFDACNASGYFTTLGFFNSPLEGDDLGYFGIQAGGSGGWPIPGFGCTRTRYKNSTECKEMFKTLFNEIWKKG